MHKLISTAALAAAFAAAPAAAECDLNDLSRRAGSVGKDVVLSGQLLERGSLEAACGVWKNAWRNSSAAVRAMRLCGMESKASQMEARMRAQNARMQGLGC